MSRTSTLFPDTTVCRSIGFEHEGPGTPAGNKKHVLVVGAGPAGMQAALVAAKRGHRVTVLEKSDRIGGHVTVQAMLPGLEDRADQIGRASGRERVCQYA